MLDLGGEAGLLAGEHVERNGAGQMRLEQFRALGVRRGKRRWLRSAVSRIEVGAQGPPGDETIHAFADALDADAGELLKAAGRSLGGPGFEDARY